MPQMQNISKTHKNQNQKNKMKKLRKQNIFNTTTAAIKFILFWLMVVIQVPIIAILPRNVAVHYMPIFMWFLLKLGGIKIVVHGKLDSRRPLMIVSNHISVFEIATFPVMFGGSFISKNDVRHWPLVGYIANKFGVVFIDRRPSHAAEALKLVQDEISKMSYSNVIL